MLQPPLVDAVCGAGILFEQPWNEGFVAEAAAGWPDVVRRLT